MSNPCETSCCRRGQAADGPLWHASWLWTATRRCAAVIGTILQEAGHEAGYAADGDQGIALFQKGGFDLAIVDLVMPVKNGLKEAGASLLRRSTGWQGVSD